MVSMSIRWYRSIVNSVLATIAWVCAALLVLSFTGSDLVGVAAWCALVGVCVAAIRTVLRGVRIGPEGVTYRGFLHTDQIPWEDIAKVDFEEVDELLVFPVFAPVITVASGVATRDPGADGRLVLHAVASYSLPRLARRTVAWHAYDAIRKGLQGS
jgi:hypothetical protein